MRGKPTWGLLAALGLFLAACGQAVLDAPGGQSVGALGHLPGDVGCSGTNNSGGTYNYNNGETTIKYGCIQVNETGNTASVTFTLSGNAQKVSLVSYKAPVWNSTDGQVVFDYVTTGMLRPGSYTLRIEIPNCQYQLDFVVGDVIWKLGTVGSGPADTYTEQNRIVTDRWGRKDLKCETAVRGAEGCTPGFWKNHTGTGKGNQANAWLGTGYQTSNLYNNVFSVTNSVNASLTLLQALNTGGGGEKALMRHAVAALLNAASGGVDYYYSVDEVIAIVQDAYKTGNFEAAKNLLAVRNEAGCPL